MRRKKKTGLIVTLSAAAVVGAVLVGCSLFGGKGEADNEKEAGIIKQVASIIGIETSDYDMEIYNTDPVYYSVTSQCYLVDNTLDFTDASHLSAGGGKSNGDGKIIAGSTDTNANSLMITAENTDSSLYKYAGYGYYENGQLVAYDFSFNEHGNPAAFSHGTLLTQANSSPVKYEFTTDASASGKNIISGDVEIRFYYVQYEYVLHIDPEQYLMSWTSGAFPIAFLSYYSDGSNRLNRCFKSTTESNVSWIKGYSYNDATNNLTLDVEGMPQSTKFMFSPGLENKQTYKVSTQASPSNGGSTSGDREGDSVFTTTVTATPNQGFLFDYWSYTNSEGVAVTSKDRQTSVMVSTSNMVCTAYFKVEQYEVKVVEENISGAGGYKGMGTYDRDGVAQISIYTNPGYDLDNWYYTDKDGVKHSGNSKDFNVLVTEDVYLHVFYKDNRVTIETKGDTRGTAKIVAEKENETGWQALPVPKDEGHYVIGKEIRIKAEPTSADYQFAYWTNKKGDHFTPNEMEIKVTEDDTYTAHFKSKELNVSISASPNDKGEVSIKDGIFVTNEDYTIPIQSDITLQARPTDSNYHFVRWERIDDDGSKEIYNNPIWTILDIKNPVPSDFPHIRFMAVFEPDRCTIKANASPQGGGTVYINGAAADLTVNSGESITLMATENEGYYVDYWQDSRGNKFSGTRDYSSKYGLDVNILKIEQVVQDETYTAVYVAHGINVTYKTEPAGAGKVSVEGLAYEESGSYRAIGGDKLTLSARANDPGKYSFNYWVDDRGNKYGDNPLQIPEIKADTTFTAVFKNYSKEDSGGVIAYASPASGGYVSKKYNDNENTVILTATENSGYSFMYWKKGNDIIGSTKVITVSSMPDGVTYVAYFATMEGKVVRTGVVNEHFYKENRRKTAPSYSVNRAGLTFLAQAQIALDKQQNDTPSPKNYEAFAHAAEYYEKHLKDNDYVFANGELVTTKGENMPITVIPAEEEAFLEDAMEFTGKKFGDRYSTEIIAAVDVKSPAGFEPGVRTYLWRNTGAEYKDNIYLLYLPNYSSNYEWSTGVVDIDESIRFTTPDSGQMVRLAAVRVTIE